jgi:hypothetical protein
MKSWRITGMRRNCSERRYHKFRRALPIFAIAAVLLVILDVLSHPLAAVMDGIVMQGGKIMLMKAGKAMEPMTANMTMSNGATVMPDGTVRLPDGEEKHMKDGQMMLMDGTIMGGGNPKPMMKPQGMDAGE